MHNITNKVNNASRGDTIVYYTGKTPEGINKPAVFKEAYDLHRSGSVSLVQRLVSRDHNNIGTFEYIAQRR